MSHTEAMIRKLDTEKVRAQLRYLYGEDETLLKTQQERYTRLIRRYFPELPESSVRAAFEARDVSAPEIMITVFPFSSVIVCSARS